MNNEPNEPNDGSYAVPKLAKILCEKFGYEYKEWKGPHDEILVFCQLCGLNKELGFYAPQFIK